MLGNILAVGLMSMGMGLSGVKDEPQMYAQDEATYTIVYESQTEWNNKAQEVYTWLSTNNYTSTSNMCSATITADFGGTDVWPGATGIYANTESNCIYIKYNTNALVYSFADNHFHTGNPTGAQRPDIVSLTIVSQAYYEGLAEPEPVMGEDIISSIASGLGIIGALATTFLTGFGNLFYSAGALTPFAVFALVMLGVAVSFAVVKLVLNLIRSNTGA